MQRSGGERLDAAPGTRDDGHREEERGRGTEGDSVGGTEGDSVGGWARGGHGVRISKGIARARWWVGVSVGDTTVGEGPVRSRRMR